jgi:hypothetical protein
MEQEELEAISKEELQEVDKEVEDQEEGLGDFVEAVIQAVVPKLAEKYKDCSSCKKRKKWLNNINGIFK